ncbi:MAG: DUF4956 domain-containing protein [Saprospiraceae bacterium]
MLKFEQYLEQFTNTINLTDFFLGFLLTALLATLIRWFYINFGDAVSNRKRFANNFLPLALVTMLIITIVKSSLALSLGLVGALSIVRFRAAIKDPEELTYLFMTIGLGLAMGANQFVMGLISIPLILLILWGHKRINGPMNAHAKDGLFINIQTDSNDLQVVTKLLTAHLPQVELKRMDNTSDGLDLSFLCKVENLTQMEKVSQALQGLSPQTRFSMIEQPEVF